MNLFLPVECMANADGVERIKNLTSARVLPSAAWASLPYKTRRFRPLTKGFALLGLMYFWNFLRRPLKLLDQMKFELQPELNSSRRIQHRGGHFKGFSPSTTPFGKRKFY